MRLTQPWPDGYTINPNGKYGPRRHPITGKPGVKHRGVDVAGVFPVTSAGDGIVAHVGYSPKGGGHVVIINHGEVHTAYYHGAHATSLRVGQRVHTGDFIYTSGTTGASTGNHLHFEVRKSRSWGTDVDPMPYLTGAPIKVVVAVTGRPDKATWSALQKTLKDKGHYAGKIDGKPGPMTYRGLQAWLGVQQSGKLDLFTRTAMQERLGLTVDGVWGRMTWGEIQRRLNEGTL